MSKKKPKRPPSPAGAAEKHARDFKPCELTPHEDYRVYLNRKWSFLAGVAWQKEQAKR